MFFQVRGCISANEVGGLFRINGFLSAEKYKLILIHHTVPAGRHLIGPTFILQQDNNHKHTVSVIKSYVQCKKEQGALEVMVSSQFHGLCLQLHEKTEGSEPVYIHSRTMVSSPRCLDQPVCRVSSENRATEPGRIELF